MRLIDADKIRWKSYPNDYGETNDDYVEKCDIDNMPTVDAVPVVHGRWISFLDGDHIMPERYYRCSRCGRVESRCQPYCHCGAKMDGERKDGGDG